MWNRYVVFIRWTATAYDDFITTMRMRKSVKLKLKKNVHQINVIIIVQRLD